MGCRLPNILTAAVLLTVAACEERMTPMVITPPLPEPLAAPALPAPGSIEIGTLPADAGSGLPDPFVATCMSEVARASGSGEVAPMGVDEGPGGQTVRIDVGEARTPWECQVDSDGSVSVARAGA